MDSEQAIARRADNAIYIHSEDYAAASQEEIDETTVIKVSIDIWSGKMKCTDNPERPGFAYEDVRKDIPAPYPWTNPIKPLTAEWKNSTFGD